MDVVAVSRTPAIMLPATAPKPPSMVLPGLSQGISFRRPASIPTVYAPMSPAFTTRISPAVIGAPTIWAVSTQNPMKRPVHIATSSVDATAVNPPSILFSRRTTRKAKPMPNEGPNATRPAAPDAVEAWAAKRTKR